MGSQQFDLSELNLDDVRHRLYEKYEITRSDADLAVQYLRCFFDAKRSHPKALIILPQIADWAWHELILDTARYRAVCTQVFGRFLHHVTKDVHPLGPRVPKEKEAAGRFAKSAPTGNERSQKLRHAFLKSRDLMQAVYGLNVAEDSEPWSETGWDRPAYRLRFSMNVSELAQTPLQRSVSEMPHALSGELKRLLTWLPERINRRFEIPIGVAEQGVREHFESLTTPGSNRGGERSILSCVAWQEHVLWTRRYSYDCYRLLGYFLDHAPTVKFAPASS